MISVIVPIYNVAPYLERCIESILHQTYRDLEIILVNDGSTDSCPEICETYRKIDGRVKVIHKQNGGTVSAKQAGVLAATGEFVGYVDADDWIESNYFAQMAKLQCQTNADMVAINLFADIGCESKTVSNTIPSGIYNCKDILPRLIYSGIFFEYGLQPHLVTKLLKRDTLRYVQGAVDPRICVGDDASVVYPYVLNAKKIAVADICGYHYVQHQGSITKTYRTDELDCIRLLIDYLEQVFKQAGVWDIMRHQLNMYQKYLLLMRQMPLLDQKILLPYGGIPYRSRVIIYGAGVTGQQMYQYLTNCRILEVLLWVDRSAAHYQREGLAVNMPEDIRNLKGEYDYILIANVSQSSADSIREYLLRLQVPAEKIRWLSKSFTEI